MAINRAVETILKGQRRLLITMATGTGKTAVAFQICWKLWSARWNRTAVISALLAAPPVPATDGQPPVAPGGAVRDYSASGAATPDPRFARLPLRATVKLRALLAQQDDINTNAYELSRKRSGFIEARTIARRNVENLEGFKGSRMPLTRDDPGEVLAKNRAIAAAQRDVDAAQAEIDVIDGRITGLNARKSTLANNVAAWLRDRVPPGPDLLEEHPAVPAPRLSKGETRPVAVAALRQKIAGLKADLAETQAAPWPSQLVKQRARAQIDALAERGRPVCLPAIEIGREIVFRTTDARVDVASAAGSAIGTAAVEDVLGLVAWLFGSELIAAVEREISEVADDAHALAPDDRKKRESALASEILQCERSEAALIEAAAADGIELPRRPDMDPRAVLGLSSSLPRPPRN
jgi:hypothetical protein